jgi:hypothetical protein
MLSVDQVRNGDGGGRTPDIGKEDRIHDPVPLGGEWHLTLRTKASRLVGDVAKGRRVRIVCGIRRIDRVLPAFPSRSIGLGIVASCSVGSLPRLLNRHSQTLQYGVSIAHRMTRFG